MSWQRVLNNDKIFLILGGFPDITNALIKRGWTESKETDPKQFSYNFLYTLKIVDIPFEDIRNDIIINHFSFQSTLLFFGKFCSFWGEMAKSNTIYN